MDLVPNLATHLLISYITLLHSFFPILSFFAPLLSPSPLFFVLKEYLLSIYYILDSCHRLVGQLSHIPEGEHGKLMGKKFVVYKTRKCTDAEMSQPCLDNSEQTVGK